jgi:iron complex transport system permease protein
VLVCDILGRTIRYPYEVPVGMVMAVVGAILFLVLILRKRNA